MQRVAGSPFTPDDPIELGRSMADMGQRMPWSYRLKGMFFRDIIERLGKEAYEAVRPELQEPPPGRYLAFSDYPMWDHQRLTIALAEVVYRGLPEAEAYRRMGRFDIATIAESTLGRVVMAMVGDARGALRRYPLMYSKVATADWTLEMSEPDDETLVFEFSGFHGLWTYQLGQIEGVASYYGASTEIDVFEDDPPSAFRFVVRV